MQDERNRNFPSQNPPREDPPHSTPRNNVLRNGGKSVFEQLLPKVLIALLLLFFAVLSFTFLADRAMSPETHERTIVSIDGKKDTVMTLTASSTLASALVSAIPDDTATPISEKLADLTQYFLVVLCILYAEKYLLTLIGGAAFKVLIPIACLLFAVGIFRGDRRFAWKRIAVKLAVCALLTYFAIPASVRVSDMIYETYETSIQATITAAEELSDQAEHLTGEDESIWSAITGAATSLKDSASKILNRFIEALAVMIVTACVIPVLVLLFFLWLIRTATGIVLPVPEPIHRKRRPGDAFRRVEEVTSPSEKQNLS